MRLQQFQINIVGYSGVVIVGHRKVSDHSFKANRNRKIPEPVIYGMS